MLNLRGGGGPRDGAAAKRHAACNLHPRSASAPPPVLRCAGATGIGDDPSREVRLAASPSGVPGGDLGAGRGRRPRGAWRSAVPDGAR